jgi:DNA-binding CsgD family transcriptional regulator
VLTPAQRAVYDLLVGGLTEKDAAGQLGVSQETVHNHVRAVYAKLGVHSRSELLGGLVGTPVAL